MAETRMAPVRTFALIAGIVYVLVGILGFIPGLLHGETDATMEVMEGNLLGLFPVNILHTLVHLLIGVWGILAYRSFDGSRAFATGLAILYLLLAVLGLIPGTRTVFGLIPIYGNDIWLHALTGAVAAFFAFSSRADRDTIGTTGTGTTGTTGTAA